MNNLSYLILLVLGSLTLGSTAYAENMRLGAEELPTLREASLGQEGAVVNVSSCANLGRQRGRLSKIQLRARRRDIHISRVRVTYGNGRTRVLHRGAKELLRGSRGGLTLNLHNSRRGRCVRKVEVSGESLSYNRNARVVVRGIN